MIVVANALALVLQWSNLSEVLPAHFDLQGTANGTIQRSILPLYPLTGGAVCLIFFLISRKKIKFQTGLLFLTSGICLVILLSTMVTLTSGTMPIFMMAEPLILLGAVVAFVICTAKTKKATKC